MNNVICIYHHNCADGFTAAWVVREALGEAVEFYPGVFREDPPDVKGKQVYIVDFSYPRDVIIKMAKEAESIHILDHHQTAIEALVDLPSNVTAVFDMHRSGAGITWEYFFGDAPPPQLLLHIEDRDLWKFDLPYTREIQAAVFSYPYDLDVWSQLMHEVPIMDLVAEGVAIERKHHKDIEELLLVTTRQMLIDGYTVPVANLPYTMSSDAAGRLAVGNAFAGCYWDTPDGRCFSLRSEKDIGLDVAKIAQLYGGGGHKHASGFRVSYEEAKTLEL